MVARASCMNLSIKMIRITSPEHGSHGRTPCLGSFYGGLIMKCLNYLKHNKGDIITLNYIWLH
jgi:hypothetical protein